MKGATVWFTGLPCSGKTTIADKVYSILRDKGYRVERLDGDIIRASPISRDLGFTKEDRRKNLERVAFIAKLLSRNDVIVLATFVSPYDDIRRDIRAIIGHERFHLIWTKCSVQECIRRDVKGMYKKAIDGEIQGFTGVDDPFEMPKNPPAELTLNTEKEDVKDSVAQVLEFMRGRGIIE